MTPVDVLGALGAILIVGAYLLLQLERLQATQLRYSLMNAVGALLILVSLTVDFNLSACLVEAFWLAVSVIGIVKGLRARRASSRAE